MHEGGARCPCHITSPPELLHGATPVDRTKEEIVADPDMHHPTPCVRPGPNFRLLPRIVGCAQRSVPTRGRGVPLGARGLVTLVEISQGAHAAAREGLKDTRRWGVFIRFRNMSSASQWRYITAGQQLEGFFRNSPKSLLLQTAKGQLCGSPHSWAPKSQRKIQLKQTEIAIL